MNSMQWNYRDYLDIWMTTDDIPFSCSLIHVFSFYFQKCFMCPLVMSLAYFFFNYKSNYIRQLKFWTRQKSKSSLCSTFWILLRDSLIAQKQWIHCMEWWPCRCLCNSSVIPILFLGWTGRLHFVVLALPHICHHDQGFILVSSVLFAWLAQFFQNWKFKCIKW